MVRLFAALMLWLALLAPAMAFAPDERVDINSAPSEQLDKLPGIGPSRAKDIVLGRPWLEPADLVKRKVLPQSAFDVVKTRIALVDVNTATAKQMVAILPGIGEVRSEAIVKGRPYKLPEDLVRKGVLTQPAFDKIKDLVVAH